jgi:hypothetical protein
MLPNGKDPGIQRPGIQKVPQKTTTGIRPGKGENAAEKLEGSSREQIPTKSGIYLVRNDRKPQAGKASSRRRSFKDKSKGVEPE